eukprot:4195422-Amphidinium_carterae.1
MRYSEDEAAVGQPSPPTARLNLKLAGLRARIAESWSLLVPTRLCSITSMLKASLSVKDPTPRRKLRNGSAGHLTVHCPYPNVALLLTWGLGAGGVDGGAQSGTQSMCVRADPPRLKALAEKQERSASVEPAAKRRRESSEEEDQRCGAIQELFAKVRKFTHTHSTKSNKRKSCFQVSYAYDKIFNDFQLSLVRLFCAVPKASVPELRLGVLDVPHLPVGASIPKQTLRISAGRVAAAAGIHPYTDMGELFLELVYQEHGQTSRKA